MYKNAIRTDCFAYDPKEPACCRALKPIDVNKCKDCGFYHSIPSRLIVVRPSVSPIIPIPSQLPSRKRGHPKKQVILLSNGMRKVYPDVTSLAKDLGISSGTVYNYLRGTTQNPQYQLQYA